MPTVVQVKKAMRAYAKEHGIATPTVIWSSPVWGKGAKVLAWRVTSHADPKHPSTAKVDVEKVLWPVPTVHILHPDYHWAGELGKRTGPPPGIVWHHAAGYGSPLEIHKYHLSIGDRGIGYHFYVRIDGSVYAGRPEWAMGAHCLGHNDWLGVCAEGNYERTRVMPPAQLKALKALHYHLQHKYGGIPDKRHRDMSGNSTACPGRYYPFEAVTK